MAIKQVNQVCKKCRGTGITDTVLKNKDGKVLLAPPYHKGEGDKPQYEPCPVCNGEGMCLQDVPTNIIVDGEKQTLTVDEARKRYETAGV